MKKFLFARIGGIVAFNVSAADFKDGVQYETLNNQASAEPRVTEFFSFYCPACRQFDQVFHISEKIENIVPKEGTYQKYHVSFMGGETGTMLTKAWGIAITLKIEDKIKPLMFDAVQEKHSINSLNDIRDVFIKAGVNEKEFDSLWNSFIIDSLFVKQQKAAEAFNIRGIPAIYVNNKYHVVNQKIATPDEFISVVDFLLRNKS